MVLIAEAFLISFPRSSPVVKTISTHRDDLPVCESLVCADRLSFRVDERKKWVLHRVAARDVAVA